MAPGVGLVNGYKLERHDPLHRVWIGKVYNFCARLLFRIRIRDIDCDYRLMRRSLMEKMRLQSTSGTICVELVRKIELSGCGVVEVGVHHYPRLHGRSQFFRREIAGGHAGPVIALMVAIDRAPGGLATRFRRFDSACRHTV